MFTCDLQLDRTLRRPEGFLRRLDGARRAACAATSLCRFAAGVQRRGAAVGVCDLTAESERLVHGRCALDAGGATPTSLSEPPHAPPQECQNHAVCSRTDANPAQQRLEPRRNRGCGEGFDPHGLQMVRPQRYPERVEPRAPSNVIPL